MILLPSAAHLGMSPPKPRGFGGTGKDACLLQTRGGALRLLSLSPGRRALWLRSALPPKAVLVHAASDARRGRIAVLYTLGPRTEVGTIRARDGAPVSAPVRVDRDVSRLAFVGGRLWLLSPHGLSDLASSSNRAARKDERPPSLDEMERSNFDFCLGPRASLMYHSESQGYLDSSQGGLSAYDLSPDQSPRRTWGYDSDRSGIVTVASTKRCLLASTDAREVVVFSLRDPRHPTLLKRSAVDDVWLGAWGDARRDVFYVVREAGLQAFRAAPDGTLMALSSVLTVEPMGVRAFADRGGSIVLFTGEGSLRTYAKTPRGSLRDLGASKVAATTAWPLRLGPDPDPKGPRSRRP